MAGSNSLLSPPNKQTCLVKNNPDPDARVKPPIRRRLLFWGRLLAWGLLGGTLAGRLGNFFFLFELCSHFAVQYAVLAASLLVLWLVSGSGGRLLAGVSASTLLINSALIIPWLMAPNPTAGGPRAIRLLHANVLYTETNYADIINLVRVQAPDIFVLQEMTPESIRGVSALTSTFPYQYHIWSKGPCSILVGSQTPIRVDSALAYPERVVSLITRVRGREIALLSIHPQIPLLPSMFADRNQQLTFVANRVARHRLPAVMLGDFNVSLFSPVYHRVFERPGLNACRRGFGLQPTWPRFLPPMYIPIDHAFVNSGFRTVDFRTLDQEESDHKAVVVDLAFVSPARQP